MHLMKALEGLDTGDVYLMLGALAVKRGDRVEARPWLDECLHRWPSNSNAWRLRLWAEPEATRPALEKKSRRWLEPATSIEQPRLE